MEDAAGEDAAEVPALTLDRFVGNGAAAPDVLKIDAEGAELEVLRGAREALASGRIRELFVETHPGALARRGGSEADVADLLERLGYAQVWAARRGVETQRHFRSRSSAAP